MAAVYGQSEGNPFFVGEIARLLVSDGPLSATGTAPLGVPRGVQEVIGRRLSRLSDGCNRLLAFAAVEGRDFDLDVVGRAARLSAAEVLEVLDEAADAHLVTETGPGSERYRFAHALIREVVYAGLRVSERVTLHHLIGEAIERDIHPDLQTRLAEIAHHFLQSAPIGDADKAIDYAVRAGNAALDLLAYEEAASHFERALHELMLVHPEERRRQCELLLTLGQAQRATSNFTSAHTTYEQAATVAASIGAAELLAQAALGLGVEFTVGIVDPAEVRLLEQALVALGEADSVLRARVLARLGKALLWTRQEEHRAALSEQAVQVARRIADSGTLAAVLHDRHMAIWGFANAEERLDITTEVIRLAQQCDDRDLAVRAWTARIGNLLELGDIPAIDAEIARYDQETSDLRQLQYRWHVPLLRASQAAIGGHFEEAEQLVQEGLVLGQRAQHQGGSLFGTAMMMVIRFGQGRSPEILDLLHENARRYPSVPTFNCAITHALVEAGREDDARAEFERLAASDFGDLPRDHLLASSLAYLTITCAALGDADRAATLYDLLLPYVNYNNRMTRIGIGSLGPIAHYLGLLAATMTRWNDAAFKLKAAIRMSTRMAAPVFLANSRYHYAQALSMITRPGEDARAMLDLALTSAQTLGIRLQNQQISSATPRSQPSQ